MGHPSHWGDSFGFGVAQRLVSAHGVHAPQASAPVAGVSTSAAFGSRPRLLLHRTQGGPPTHEPCHHRDAAFRRASASCLTKNTVRGSVSHVSSMVALVEQHASEPEALSPPLCAFLSFATRDKVLVDGFRNEIEQQQPNIELLDHAADENYEAHWKHDCARKIHRSALLICLVGASTHKSEAVSWEVGRGLELGKRVVAVNLTRRPVRMPAILAQNAIEPLPSSDSLISFVAELAPLRRANGRP